MAEPLEKYFKNKRFSLREIKEAQKKLDLKPRGGDEEYAEVVLKEYAELLPYREVKNSFPSSIKNPKKVANQSHLI